MLNTHADKSAPQIFNTDTHSQSLVFLTVKLVLESARWGVDKKTESVMAEGVERRGQ